MKTFRSALAALILITFATLAAAANLTGTVTNKTTNKPAARADVILLKLAQGMEEAARTKTDAQGHYTIALDDDNAPHLVRVVFKDVTYHKMSPPGTTTADVDVYDAAPKVADVKTGLNIIKVEPQSGQVTVLEMWVVRNQSKPPRTQMSDRTFEFTIPADAKIDSSLVATANGMPLNGSPIPGKKPGAYAFMFPLRPGETRFQVAYHQPYSGSAEWKPAITGPLEHFVVMVPKGVTITPNDPSLFEATPDEQGATVRVATNVDPKRDLGFKVSGTGISPPEGQEGQPSAAGGAAAPADANGRELPGGGIGKPIESPNPLQQYMWWILGGFIVLLAAGAWFFYKQPVMAEEEVGAPSSAKSGRLNPSPRTAVHSPAARPAGNGRSALLLDAL